MEPTNEDLSTDSQPMRQTDVPPSLKDKTEALKSLRISINLVIAGARDIADMLIQRGDGGRELSLCITNLQQARMWAGEALGELGHKLPPEYRDDGKQ